MTHALEKAIAKLAALPPAERDRVAGWLLDELRDEEDWVRQFAELPLDIREAPRRRIASFATTQPSHLQFEKAHDRQPTYSARVTGAFRVVLLLQKDEVTWFWIGGQADYDRILKKL